MIEALKEIIRMLETHKKLLSTDLIL